MGWMEFALAMAAFFASHRIPAALGLKTALVRVLGRAGYAIAFSVASTLLLWWVILAAGRAPFLPLWDQQSWHRWLVNLIMPLVCALAAYGIAAPNPFAFEGRSTGFDPDRPGIAGLTRQPLLWALALWSAAHLTANGDLAHVLLFAPFLAFSILGMPLVEARIRRSMPPQDWQRLTARTSPIPFAALLSRRFRPASPPSALRGLIAIAAWAALWYLHAPVIGVPPTP